jgi:serine/threonine protein kinase
VIVSAGTTDANQNEWIKYIKERVQQKHPKMLLQEIRYTDGERDKAVTETRNALNKYPKLKGVLAICAPGVPGAAEALKQANRSDVKLTGTSNVVGSPGFMSPEQFRSSKSVDARTDVWSLGVILYKLISGRLPFKADGFAEFALAITREQMPPLAEAPPEFQAVVARCLEKDAAKRYPDVLALAEALAPFAAHPARTSLSASWKCVVLSANSLPICSTYSS